MIALTILIAAWLIDSSLQQIKQVLENIAFELEEHEH